MLLGKNIHIFTDHKKLTFDTFTTQHVLMWRNYCEEYAPIIHYIEGERNILADNISRLHRLSTPTQIAEGKRLIQPVVVNDTEDTFDSFLDTYLNLPESEVPEENPLNYEHIAEMQKSDENLKRLRDQWPNQYMCVCICAPVERAKVVPGEGPERTSRPRGAPWNLLEGSTYRAPPPPRAPR